MACGCGGGAGKGTLASDTLGYYVILPGGMLLPAGVNPDDPAAGTAPFMFAEEAHREVVDYGGGTIRRIKRQPAVAAIAPE